MNPGKLRAKAAVTLGKLLAQEGSLASLLNRGDFAVDDSSFPLLQEIVFGTCRWYYQLDAILTQLLTKPLKAKDNDVRCLLLIGLYQLHHLRVPDYAVVNETVAATKALKKDWAKGLVNAILRGFLRDREALIQKSLASPQGEYAHPRWLIESLRNAWPTQWAQILEDNNIRPPMTLRVNTHRIDIDAFIANLQQAGIEATPGTLASSSVYLASPCPVESIPGFEEGLCSVQDEASQLIPALLDLRDGLRILDACAAPGGKTCHILESGFEFKELVALDNDSRRLERLQQNLDRLRLSATVSVGDAGTTSQWWDGKAFDRILLDAPCSATGIIRRHPDIKLLRRGSDIPKLCLLQAQLLESLWACLNPGGLLLYSTCSVLPQENSAIVSQFLEAHSDAKLETIDAQWGVECSIGKQLLPGAGGNDGFYFARLRKLDATSQSSTGTALTAVESQR
jgi:16S rRNA (cytosine967-C5)-methyltransferase